MFELGGESETREYNDRSGVRTNSLPRFLRRGGTAAARCSECILRGGWRHELTGKGRENGRAAIQGGFHLRRILVLRERQVLCRAAICHRFEGSRWLVFQSLSSLLGLLGGYRSFEGVLTMLNNMTIVIIQWARLAMPDNCM